MRVDEVFAFVHERHQIYLRRQAGQPKPWTANPILQQYRFTNVYRELDRVTIWIRENWREPHMDDPHLWFAMCVARYFNWPATLEELGYPSTWNPARVCTKLHAKHSLKTATMARSHKETSHKIERTLTKISPQIFGGAYFLNSIGPKIESIVNDRLTPLWVARKQITRDLAAAQSLAEVHAVFRAQHGFGNFMAAQVVVDLKHTPRFDENRFSDWWVWAASGPGSKRGLNRICGRPVNAPWKEAEWLRWLHELQAALAPMLAEAGMPRVCSMDTQGVTCEYDKMERVRLGEGRPKQRYNGGA